MPDADSAYVEPEKARDYLLHARHRANAGKAAFFARFGFTREDWMTLANALVTHARAFEATPVAALIGMRYVVDGPLESPSGRRPWVRSVWEVKDGGPPRLVTAYPLKARDDDPGT